MGCFSFKCKICRQPINCYDDKEEGVKLFVLQKGEVLEEMEGNYNSYGKVDNLEWKNEWNQICDLMFNSDERDGMAAIHTDCWNGIIPETQSEDDENQGWNKVKRKPAEKNYHKFYKKIDRRPNLEREKALREINDKISVALKDAEEFLTSVKKKK